MKKTASLICAAACAALAAAPVYASAADTDGKVYGTMNIPYADFYAAEIDNAYEVDAVSSATENKWKMNGEGQLVAGTFNDDNGTILGVTYPVEVSSADVDKLADYGFTALDSKPTAYKEVSLDGSKLTVSKVVDTDGEKTVDGSADVSTSTRYGDYQLNVKGYPEEATLYGVIVNTKEGDKYALRHLENIWRAGAISWSAGITTVEGHGNTLKYDNYASSMGKTVTSVTFITFDGVTTVNVGDQYLPVKFAGEVKAEDSAAGTGKTSLTLTGFPEDYKKSISVGDGFTVSESEISYTNAKPGSYTVSVTDESGKYAPMSGSFTLTTADVPVKYADDKLAKADGFTDDDAANFIKNIVSVEVNGTKFSASGKGAVKVFGEDGAIDFDAESRNGKVFDGSGNYTITVTATGYTEPYSFEVKSEAETTASTQASSTATTTTSATTSKGTTSSKATTNPQTGVSGVAVPAAILALAGAAAFAMKKRND
ncbi:MAG: NPXTG-anchored protein [Ruminococcus sp.]|nr:NPXTG-anchored protein [Ruminococcus sp.]